VAKRYYERYTLVERERRNLCFQVLGTVNGILRPVYKLRAMNSLIIPYLRYREAKYAINRSLRIFDRLIRYMQVRVRENFKYKVSRKKYLFHYWE